MINLNSMIKNIFENTLNELGPLGSYQFHGIVIILFLLTKQYTEFTFLILGYFLIKIFAIPFRILMFKERPKAKKYTNIFEKISAASFPSLHTARTSFLLLFLINYFNKDLYFSLFFSIITILILYSRIYFKKHYLKDIFVGIFFGAIPYYILKFYL
ncbi:MAG: phosphatase PAP2 family protein [Candidatus Woesearchaeota archaeon]|jgi:membrane-associated phospholipid phosphatase|nr:phosphatase PAP2 family protein [Candidatus Woesearchaeota archaeon]